MSEMGELRAPTGIKWNNADQTVGVVDYSGGRLNTAIFYMRPIHNPQKSKELNTTWFDDVPHVRIAPPGERLNVIDRPASAQDKRTYALQWAQFEQNQQQRPSGTPISTLYPQHPSIIAMLEASQVWTVEQLAGLSANAIESIGMGCQRYVNDAQQYMAIASKGVKAAQFREAMQEKDQQIETLKQQVDQLTATVNSLVKEKKKGVSLREVQETIAGAMERPVHMPHTGFDEQGAMIAALGTQSRPAPKAAMAKPARRERPRLEE